jgi:hypothetical protein
VTPTPFSAATTARDRPAPGAPTAKGAAEAEALADFALDLEPPRESPPEAAPEAARAPVSPLDLTPPAGFQPALERGAGSDTQGVGPPAAAVAGDGEDTKPLAPSQEAQAAPAAPAPAAAEPPAARRSFVRRLLGAIFGR